MSRPADVVRAGSPGPGYRRALADPRPRAGVGMLGYGFMGKAHSNALRTMTYIDWPGVMRPELVAIAGRTNERVADAAVRYGFDGYYTDWHGLVEDERLSVFDNAAADEAHVQPTLAFIAAGKHVVCEKPLARSAADASAMWKAAEKAGVKHLCCYNYRFVPAVQLARNMLRGGGLGEVYEARFRYSQSWSPMSDSPTAPRALSGDHRLPCHRPGALSRWRDRECLGAVQRPGQQGGGQSRSRDACPGRRDQRACPIRQRRPGHHRRLIMFPDSTQHARLGDQLRERHARMGSGAPERAESVRNQLFRSLARWTGRRHRLRAWPSLR